MTIKTSSMENWRTCQGYVHTTFLKFGFKRQVQIHYMHLAPGWSLVSIPLFRDSLARCRSPCKVTNERNGKPPASMLCIIVPEGPGWILDSAVDFSADLVMCLQFLAGIDQCSRNACNCWKTIDYQELYVGVGFVRDTWYKRFPSSFHTSSICLLRWERVRSLKILSCTAQRFQ